MQDGAPKRAPLRHPAPRDKPQRRLPEEQPASHRTIGWLVFDLGQLTRRTNPQISQVAIPVAGSNSRKLGQPLVPQKSLELATAVERRRMRRIADARPVTDDVAERVIMVCCCCCFLARRHREMSDRLRGRCFVPCAKVSGSERRFVSV